MKKLFDETHGSDATDYRRTIWYLDDENNGTINCLFSEPDQWGGRMVIPDGDYSELAFKMHELIGADKQIASEHKPSETHWIFYSNIVNGDAIEDKPRFSIFVRLKNDLYSCNINMSDYIFATSFDETIQIKKTIEELLNVM